MGLKREEGKDHLQVNTRTTVFVESVVNLPLRLNVRLRTSTQSNPPSFICAAGQLTEPDGGHSSLLAHLHCRADNAALLLLDIPWMLPS